MLRAVLIVLLSCLASYAELHVCGDVSGNWELTDSPVVVDCNIRLLASQQLTIAPGVQVLFSGAYKFDVYGDLQAVGTADDSILFGRLEPIDDHNWAGIRFSGGQASGGLMEYCVFEYSHKGNGNDENTNGGAIHTANSSPTISRCTFRHNEGSRGSAICVFDGSNSLIERCVFHDNNSLVGYYAVWFSLSNGSIRRSTLANNTGGDLHCYNSGPDVTSCILWSIPAASGAQISYSCVRGGYNGVGNISSDPQFDDADSRDYHLQVGSPCINAGDPDAQDEDGSRADMGAFPTGDIPPEGVIVDHPAAGDTLVVGEILSINWQSQGVTGDVLIELNRGFPDGPWEVLAASTPNDGQFPWLVSAPPGNQCRLRVCSVQQEGLCGVSRGDFVITVGTGFLALVRSTQPATALTAWNVGNVECPGNLSEWFRLKNFGNAATIVYQPLEPVGTEFSRVTGCPGLFALGSGEMSACSVQLSFASAVDGTYGDLLRIQSDAENAVNGFVQIPLSAVRVTTPAAPQLTVLPVGDDVRLAWRPVTTSEGGCPVEVAHYLVFHAPTSDGPYYFLGSSDSSPFYHEGVVSFEAVHYYRVLATEVQQGELDAIPSGEQLEDVMKRLP